MGCFKQATNNWLQSAVWMTQPIKQVRRKQVSLVNKQWSSYWHYNMGCSGNKAGQTKHMHIAQFDKILQFITHLMAIFSFRNWSQAVTQFLKNCSFCCGFHIIAYNIL